MRKHVKSFVPFLLCLALFVSLFVPSASAASESPEEHKARQPDYTKTGSITVDILLADKETAVPGGTLTAYLVAQAREKDGNNDFVYVAPFGEGIVDAEYINSAEAGAPDLAAKLAAKAGAGGKTVKVDSNGRAEFTDLTLGLYLIVQKTPAKGYEPIRSFLVTVPMWDGENLVYDVYANPKPSTTTKDLTINLTAEKVVKIDSGTPDANEKFSFRLTARTKDAPMPANATVDEETGVKTVTVTRRGAGTVPFGSIVFGPDNVEKTYIYQVEELRGTNSKYTYDTRKYLVTVKVYMENGVIKASASCACSDNTKVTKISFVNRFKDSTPLIPVIPHRPSLYYLLPQTGHRTWLVSVLAGLGLGLFLLGWCLRRKGEGDS